MSFRKKGQGGSRPSSLLFFPILIVALALASGVFTQACREQSTFEIDRNLPPETVLTGAPGDSTTTFYVTHLHWYGVDPDGEVVAFEFAVTDSVPEAEDEIPWKRTAKTDSIFAIPVGETEEIMGRRFYVRAIDNEGRRDPTPAITFFTVRDNEAPEIEFTRSRGVGPGGEEYEITSTDLVVPSDTIPTGWRVEFAWRGRDDDTAVTENGDTVHVGRVLGYSYHLSPFESSYLGGSLADTVARYDNLLSGSYSMFVRGTDDAGFSALNPTIRSFVWNQDPRTSFEMGYDSTRADSAFHFFNEDGAERFAGDTLALNQSGRSVRTKIRGFDPDDPEGLGRVRNFQTRLEKDGGGLGWRAVASSREVQYLGLKTGNYRLLGRCEDLLGRQDGSAASLMFVVNYAPRFIPHYVFGPITADQVPADGQIFTTAQVDSFLPVDILARDPDRLSGDLRLVFSYRFTAPFSTHFTLDFAEPGGIGTMVLLPGGAERYQGRVRPRRREQPVFLPGDYILEARVSESRGPTEAGNIRHEIRQIRFSIIEP